MHFTTIAAILSATAVIAAPVENSPSIDGTLVARACDSTKNLFTNPGFESGVSPWTIKSVSGSGSANGRVQTQYVATNGGSQAYAIDIKVPKGGSYSFNAGQKVAAGIVNYADYKFGYNQFLYAGNSNGSCTASSYVGAIGASGVIGCLPPPRTYQPANYMWGTNSFPGYAVVYSSADSDAGMTITCNAAKDSDLSYTLYLDNAVLNQVC